MNAEDQSIVYFDGVCGLCNRSVTWLFERDKRRKLRFAPLQGSTAKEQLSIPEGASFDTIIFSDQGNIYYRSTAILKIVQRMGGGWKLLYGFIIFPRPFRDWIYKGVANNRYKWFGKHDSCRLPTEAEAAYFLP